MLTAHNAHLISHSELVAERPEGVAFFLTAKELYGWASITYLCVNIPLSERARRFAHCVYSDTGVAQYASQDAVRLSFEQAETESGVADEKSGARRMTLALGRRRGETAFLEIASANKRAATQDQEIMRRECRILANYFHGHVLRMHGYDAEQELLISARELDCLKWTAVGKTALEASIILGISERTVRFHLNAAREKLDCVTTTQAVAKAIVNQLIEI
jgi:DNA-binding CsgD family transcriptional regulator